MFLPTDFPEEPKFIVILLANMAEREGFEPSEPVRVQLISSQSHSASLAPLQWEYCSYLRSFYSGGLE